MARPIDADPQATRARIQAAATRLFSERGLHAVSMRELARAAHTTPGTLHHYFGSKQGLYQACTAPMYAQVQALQARFVASLAGTAPEQLAEQAVRQGWALAREHRQALRLVQRTVLDAGEASEPRRQQALDATLDLGSQALAAHSDLPPAERRAMLYSVVLLINRVVLLEDQELLRIWPDGKVEDHLVQAAKRLLGL